MQFIYDTEKKIHTKQGMFTVQGAQRCSHKLRIKLHCHTSTFHSTKNLLPTFFNRLHVFTFISFLTVSHQVLSLAFKMHYKIMITYCRSKFQQEKRTVHAQHQQEYKFYWSLSYAYLLTYKSTNES